MQNQFLPILQGDRSEAPINPDLQRYERIKKSIKERKPANFEQVVTEEGERRIVPREKDAVEHALSLYDTTGADNPNTALQLIEQANVLASNAQAKALNVTSDLMSSIRPQDALEGMLASQLVACHNMAMEFASKAMIEGQPTAVAENYLNRANKTMRLFGQHLETLHRMRQKGQQTIQVQHIHLGNVNQAVVGNINQQ
jgi:hypothetical protein